MKSSHNSHHGVERDDPAAKGRRRRHVPFWKRPGSPRRLAGPTKPGAKGDVGTAQGWGPLVQRGKKQRMGMAVQRRGRRQRNMYGRSGIELSAMRCSLDQAVQPLLEGARTSVVMHRTSKKGGGGVWSNATHIYMHTHSSTRYGHAPGQTVELVRCSTGDDP